MTIETRCVSETLADDGPEYLLRRVQHRIMASAGKRGGGFGFDESRAASSKLTRLAWAVKREEEQ